MRVQIRALGDGHELLVPGSVSVSKYPALTGPGCQFPSRPLGSQKPNAILEKHEHFNLRAMNGGKNCEGSLTVWSFNSRSYGLVRITFVLMSRSVLAVRSAAESNRHDQGLSPVEYDEKLRVRSPG